ncbi:MAG: hypothetical protein Q8873_00680 [Bacillota bacterium]|nr:hypothetical protein [Bacillota bacterium]
MSKLKPLSGQEAMNELIDHLLGKNWYVVDPLSTTQVNAIAVGDIKRKFPKRKKLVIRRVYFDE